MKNGKAVGLSFQSIASLLVEIASCISEDQISGEIRGELATTGINVVGKWDLSTDYAIDEYAIHLKVRRSD